MTERDYARILWWKGKTLGLMLVNCNGRNFFLHGDTLLELVKHESKLRLVKRKDRDPDGVASYHPGDVVGLLVRRDKSTELTLYLGEGERRVKIDRLTGEISHVVEEQHYVLPTPEFEAHYRCIELMIQQQTEFDRRWRESRFAIPEIYFVGDD